MIETTNTYVHGTAARKIQYDVYEENTVLRAKKRQKSNNKAKVKLIFGLLVIFALVLLVIYRYTLITEVNYNLDKSVKSYMDIKNENSILKVNIEKQTDLSQIHQIAEDKLGMHKPDKYQVVYVSVPKSDYSIVSQEYTGSGNHMSLFATITDKLGRLTQLIY